MGKETNNIVPGLEEINLPETVIDLNDDDVVIDIPEDDNHQGEFEEITGLEDITSSTLIIEDEEPQRVHELDDIVKMTEDVDALNTIKKATSPVDEHLQKKDDKLKDENEAKIFEDIPDSYTSNEVKDANTVMSYDNTFLDDEKIESKGKIYFDKDKDALIIEPLEDEKFLEVQENPKDSKNPLEELQPINEKEAISNIEFNKLATQDDGVSENRITIEVPPEVQKKLKEKNLDDFYSINLNEAEQIANEDILVLSEDDLIEELEECDLIPITITQQKTKSNVDQKSTVGKSTSQPVEEVTLEIIKRDEHEDKDVMSFDKKEEDIIKTLTHDNEILKSQNAIIEEVHEDIPVEVIVDDAGLKEVQSISVNRKKSESREDTEFDEYEYKKSNEQTLTIGDKSTKSDIDSVIHTDVVETIPVELRQSVAGIDSRIMIIDDAGVDTKDKQFVVTNFEDIDKLVSGLIDITEGEVKILHEANPKEEGEHIAPILTGTLPTFHDRIMDLDEEYTFKDDDIVFVDNAILLDEYERYLKVIDEYYESKNIKKTSSSVELFGLTKDELEFFYNVLFEKEYEKIKATESFKNVLVGRDSPEKDEKLVKQFKYIQANPKTLSQEEKHSIEEDIDSPVAVVIEESIDDIVKRLKKIKPDIEVNTLLRFENAQSKAQDETAEAIQYQENIQKQEDVLNITDKVIILDNKEDVNRFVDTLPAGKQENIKKLLRYLDSLFEKLPEDVIRNFANSEYFDLYVKVLNDLGV